MVNLKPSKQKILKLLKTSPRINLNEISKRLKLGKTTVRQHLKDLESAGIISSTFKKAPRGRPELIYILTEASTDLFPSQDKKLLTELVSYLKTTGNEDLLEEFLKNYWKSKQNKFQAKLNAKSSNDLKTRVSVLRSLFEEEGFMPKVERRNTGEISIHECNCPFTDTVKLTSLPCKLEQEFIKYALNTPVKRKAYMLTGDATCSYQVLL